jgi:hypothetical protein
MTHPLATIEDPQVALAPSPREVIADAAEQAEALMEVVNAKGLSRRFSRDAKPYLEAGAWQIILAFNHTAPKVEYVKPIYDEEDGPVVAYEAKMSLIDIRTGAWRGEGISECAMDAYPTKGKQGRDKDKAAKSAAQTWALSKAARISFGWVAELAGFEPTPAHEMEASHAPETDYGTCPKHNVPYFMRGGMTSPGHKDENDRWCNRPKDDAEFAAKASSGPTEPISEPQATKPPVLDLANPDLTLLGAAPTESDGGPALFPDETNFANANDLKKSLAKDFGLNTQAKVEEALETVGQPVWAEIRDLNEAYATLAHHFAEQAGSDG